MKLLKVFSAILFICLWASTPSAHIYSWIDADGVLHFTNHSPPKEAKIVLREPLIQSYRAADRENVEIEEPEGKQGEKGQDLEKGTTETKPGAEGGLERSEALVEDLEKRLNGANRRAEEALKRAEALGRELENRLREADEKADEAIEEAEVSVEESYSTGLRQYTNVIYLNSHGIGFLPLRRPRFPHHKGPLIGRPVSKHGFKFRRNHRLSPFRLKKHHGGLNRKHLFTREHFRKRHGDLHHQPHFNRRHFRKHNPGFRFRSHFGRRPFFNHFE